MNGTFVCGSTYEDVYRFERHLVFPRLFAANAYDYISINTTFNADERKAGTARRFCCERLSDTVNAYSLEISTAGYILKDNKTKTTYLEDGCKIFHWTHIYDLNTFYSFSDSRFGRNIARTLLQYYRFINVLPIPIAPEINPKGKTRPKTHLSRDKTRKAYEVQVRPKTTRNYAPISYNDLSICYESVSSDEACSPIRQSFVVSRKNTQPKPSSVEHYSMMSIKSSKFDKLILAEADQKNKTNIKQNDFSPFHNSELDQEEAFVVNSKQYLSIIDFNKLTRTSIDKAVANSKRS